MKTLRLFLLVLLMPLFARAASPSFNSFLPTWFTNNGVVIGLNTNLVITWQTVSANSFTTNGNNLAVNTNTFPTLPVVYDIVNNASNQLATNTWTTILTNIYRMSGKVMIGTTNYASNAKLIVDSSGHTFAIFATNSASGTQIRFATESGVNGSAYIQNISAGNGNSILAANGGLYSYIELITRSNSAGNGTVLLVNGDNRTYYDIGGRTPFVVSNATPSGTIITGSDGIVRFAAAGGGIAFTNLPLARQFTVATNAVRVFAGTGTTVTITNNTANGSLDYRIDASGGVTSYAPVVIPTTETNMVFSTATNAWFTYSLTNNTTFTVSSLAVGAQATLYLTADGSTRTLSFPGFTWLEGVPASIAAGKRMRIHMFSFGTTATNVSAVYAVEL